MRSISHNFRSWLIVILSACIALFGCSQTPPNSVITPTQDPARSPIPIVGTATSTPVTATVLSAEDALIATIAAGTTATATSAVPIPTAYPTITLAPPAEPHALGPGWWDKGVCYEVFIRSFYDSNGDGIGDLNGLIAKLDYINDGNPETQTDLGANCIWLMPVMQSSSYHGYDVDDYYKVEEDYGTNEDFARLIDAAHERGIAIILDLVLNHTSSQHPWFIDALNNPDSPYRDYYIWSPINPNYLGPWGEAVWHRSPVRDEYYYGVFWQGMPDLNYRNPAVTEEIHKISAFWLKDMRADGFRLDAVKHFVEANREQENTRETHAWLHDYASFLRSIKADSFTVGEVFDGRSGILESYYPDQLDTYFEFGLSNAILDAARTGNGAALVKTVAGINQRLPYQRWASFLTNHDQERAMSVLGEDSGNARIAAMALMTLPGIPFVYYGEEIGMIGKKPDENLRSPMQWSAEPNAGFSTVTAWQGLQSNAASVHVAAQEGDPQSLLNLYRKLIHLRTGTAALAKGSFTPLEITSSSSSSVAAFVRYHPEGSVLVILNFSKQTLEGLGISASASDIPAASYQLSPLFGEGTPSLEVRNGGAFELTNLPPVPGQSGLIYALK